MYENTFKQIDDILRRDMSTELDYVEQASWVLFLKYLSDFEAERKGRAGLAGEQYKPAIHDSYTWRTWAYPLNEEKKLNDNAIRTGADLINFVNRELFPYFKKLRETSETSSIKYKIGEIFSEIENKYKSGSTLRDVIDRVEDLSFKKSSDIHELSELYEQRIKNMGNAGRNGGQFYTPRPLIRAMVSIIDPKIGETVYDGAAGSAGFLCEAFDHLNSGKLTAHDKDILMNHTLYGQEKVGLSFIIGNMNLILHGVESPNLILTNSLNENVMDFQDKDKHDIILANPPFGGSGEDPSVRHNFPIRTSEPAYMFLQHFIRKLKIGGRAAIVIKNTFLSNADKASITLRKDLLTECNLHSILCLPTKVFQAGTQTVVLFFIKGEKTNRIWYYDLDPGRSLGKTNPINDNDLTEFVALQKSQEESSKSWIVSIADIDTEFFELSPKNPNESEEAPLRSPQEIIENIENLNQETSSILDEIKEIQRK